MYHRIALMYSKQWTVDCGKYKQQWFREEGPGLLGLLVASLPAGTAHVNGQNQPLLALILTSSAKKKKKQNKNKLSSPQQMWSRFLKQLFVD